MPFEAIGHDLEDGEEIDLSDEETRIEDTIFDLIEYAPADREALEKRVVDELGIRRIHVSKVVDQMIEKGKLFMPNEFSVQRV